MGNFQTKNDAQSILKKLDEGTVNTLNYRRYNDKVHKLIIHRLEKEYYIETNLTTMGPMTRDQFSKMSLVDVNLRLQSTTADNLNEEFLTDRRNSDVAVEQEENHEINKSIKEIDTFTDGNELKDNSNNQQFAKGDVECLPLYQKAELTSTGILKRNTLGFTEPISNEKVRYTAYAKTDDLNWTKIKNLIRRMSSGFKERFNCEVRLGNELIPFRGDVFYTINIDGKTKQSILMCRNCLPIQLKSILIQSRTNAEESVNVAHEKWYYNTSIQTNK